MAVGVSARLLDKWDNSVEYFFIGKAEESGDAVALLINDNEVQWENGQELCNEYQLDSTLVSVHEV